LWDTLDVKKLGYLQKQQLATLMTNLGLQYTEHEFANFFESLDVNGDGKINFEEFISGLRWLQKGVAINNSAQVSTEQKLEILQNYLTNLVKEGLSLANTEFDNNKHHTTKAILKIIDIPLLETIESSVGTIMTEEAKQIHQTLNQKIDKKKNKK